MMTYNPKDEALKKGFTMQNDHLCWDGRDLVQVAADYGTPLFVFSQRQLRQNVTDVCNAFRKLHHDTHLFYASKANSNVGVLKVLRAAGASIEVNSGGELQKAKIAGYKPEQIVFNGVAKTQEEIRLAVEYGIASINVDSEYELKQVISVAEKLCKKANVAIRVEPQVPSPTHPGLVTAYHSKAGIDMIEAPRLFKVADDHAWVNLKGIHFHVGSQVPILEPFIKATRIIVDLVKQLHSDLKIKLEHINIGGGIPIPYKMGAGDPLEDFFYAGFSEEELAAAVVPIIEELGEEIKIFLEPGRRIVGNTAVMLSRILCEKEKVLEKDVSGKVHWLMADVGFSTLLETNNYDWYFLIASVNRFEEVHNKPFKLAGPLCDGGDYYHGADHVPEFKQLPSKTAPGDVIAFMDVGAYTLEQMFQYNGRPRVGAVLLGGDDQVIPIRRKDTFGDLIAQDIWDFI